MEHILTSTQPEGESENEYRFSLEKPEGYGKHKKRAISLKGVPIPQEGNFDQLNKTGDHILDELGKERVVKAVTYALSDRVELHVRGRSYDYRDKKNNKNQISAEYNKSTGELVKMHFQSENPFFVGKAIVDLIERIPPNSEVLGGEVSMSSDSFPLLLNTIGTYLQKTPDRFSVSQIGEFVLNDQGKYNNISQAETVQQKIDLLNEYIESFREKTAIEISNAKLEMIDGAEKIIIPKLKIVKMY